MIPTMIPNVPRSPSLSVVVNGMIGELPSRERDTAQWHQAIGVARQACARIFRDGGRPIDAVQTFGLNAEPGDWSKAVILIAETLCASPLRRAA